jgi:hypothetical protein
MFQFITFDFRLFFTQTARFLAQVKTTRCCIQCQASFLSEPIITHHNNRTEFCADHSRQAIQKVSIGHRRH